MWSATFREQILYLFDIVASLCAGFNEHDIQFLSSLLALLRGDLSAPGESRGRGEDGRTDRIWKERQRGQVKGTERRGKKGRDIQELNPESCFEQKVVLV